ncbi:MAG: hypothetical protein WB588_05450 [Dehalococcoidia bacterium]
MPAERRWYKFTRENVEKLPKGKIGVYVLANENKKPMRTGSSTSENVGIRGRLISHIIHNTCPEAKYFRFAYANSPQEALNMEANAYNHYIRQNPVEMSKHTKRIPRKREIDDFWLF